MSDVCGFQVTLLKQNIGSMGRHIQTPADKEAKVGKSDVEDKENVNYVLVNIAVFLTPLQCSWIVRCLGGGGSRTAVLHHGEERDVLMVVVSL